MLLPFCSTRETSAMRASWMGPGMNSERLRPSIVSSALRPIRSRPN